MKYRSLGTTGLKVSELCLGTMTFGGQTAAKESEDIIRYALDQGVNFIDTANIYTHGESERIIGRALKGSREKVVIATKTGGPTGMGPNESGLSRKQILASVDDSLTRLNTDYIDILYAHFPDRNTAEEEYLETFTDLVRSGKIRYYGVSNFSAWQCCELCFKAEKMGLAAPCVTEDVYSIINRGIESELVPFLQKHRMALTVFNPLAGGLLTGKHCRDHYTEGTRFGLEKGYVKRYWNDKNFDAIDRLKEILKDEEVSMIELAYQWLLDKAWVTSIICGVSKVSQIVENAGYFGGRKIDPGLLESCDEVWQMIAGEYFRYHR